MKMNASILQNALLSSLLLGQVSFSLKEIYFPLCPKRGIFPKWGFYLPKGLRFDLYRTPLFF